MKILIPVVFLFSVLCAACKPQDPPQHETTSAEEPQPTAVDDRQQQLNMFEQALRTHVPVLSSDDFEGRAPATSGEEKTTAYLREQFSKLGLEPGNHGDWFQAVPVTEITLDPSAVLHISGKNFNRDLQYKNDVMVFTQRQVKEVILSKSEMVFVGYGISAPEYNWDDYAGFDVKGKTVVMLVNDPGYATQDPALFKGNTMTYYGRWTYKYEEAARQGAAAALIIHQDGAAGYPWEVVASSWSGAQVTITANDKNKSRVAVEGWIPLDIAKDLFDAAHLDFDQLTQAAAQPGFSPVPMKLQASTQLKADIRESQSNNVLALIPGTETPGEAIVYTAHWDHLGKKTDLDGDQIYNGALDNATGTAALIGLANAFIMANPKPKRSILFLATTAEESGLLGSKYYATHPIFEPAQTVAALNIDAMAIFGPTRDVSVVGYGNSELDDYLADAAKKQDRYLVAEDTPEKGYYFRSDHFNMAKVGIPALYAESGVDHIEKGKEWARQKVSDYIGNHYHKPSDEWNPDWDLRGAALDMQLYFDVGYRLSLENAWPAWSEGSEFKLIRAQSRPIQ